MAVPSKPSIQKAWLGYVQTGGKNLGLALASRGVRLLLIIIALVATFWLVYVNVFKTLSQPVSLPASVLPNNPELDTKSLQAINNARVTRSQYQLKSFGAYDSFFITSLTTTPTPLP